MQHNPAMIMRAFAASVYMKDMASFASTLILELVGMGSTVTKIVFNFNKNVGMEVMYTDLDIDSQSKLFKRVTNHAMEEHARIAREDPGLLKNSREPDISVEKNRARFAVKEVQP